MLRNSLSLEQVVVQPKINVNWDAIMRPCQIPEDVIQYVEWDEVIPALAVAAGQ